MKTLEVEQITETVGRLAIASDVPRFRELVATAKAGAHLASMCRGAIAGCDATTDPRGHIADMLTQFLVIAGFEP